MSSDPEAPAVTADQLNAFFEETFVGEGERPEILTAGRGHLTVRLRTDERHLRPGNFVSGPTQMALADQAAYAVLFTVTGVVPMALTSNLSINFLRPCQGSAIEAEAAILKVGRSSAVMEVTIGPSDGKPSSHSVVTYAMPKG